MYCCARYSHRSFVTKTGGLGNKRTSEDHRSYGIKIGQKTEKNPRDLKRFAVTQHPKKKACENSQMSKMIIFYPIISKLFKLVRIISKKVFKINFPISSGQIRFNCSTPNPSVYRGWTNKVFLIIDIEFCICRPKPLHDDDRQRNLE